MISAWHRCISPVYRIGQNTVDLGDFANIVPLVLLDLLSDVPLPKPARDISARSGQQDQWLEEHHKCYPLETGWCRG